MFQLQPQHIHNLQMILKTTTTCPRYQSSKVSQHLQLLRAVSAVLHKEGRFGSIDFEALTIWGGVERYLGS